MHLYRGSPSAIHHHWRHRMQSLAPEERRRSILIVPDPHLSYLLQERVPECPAVMVLDHWLEACLPQHIMPAPLGSWEFLSGLVPPALIASRDRDTPGFLPQAAAMVRWGRSLGISRIRPGTHDRLDWPGLWDWYDRQFRGALADQLRLYEYAAVAKKVPLTDSGAGVLFVYGFSPLSSPLINLLRQWARHSAVEVWALDGLGSAGLEELPGVLSIPLDPPSEKRPATQVIPPAGGDLLEAAVSLLSDLPELTEGSVYVATPAVSTDAWVRALARQNLVDESLLLLNREHRLWQTFLAVADGSASQSLINRWLEEAGALGSAAWARQWWEQALQIGQWSELLPLLEETSYLHGNVWPFIIGWGRGIKAWDHWGAPTPSSVAAGLRVAGGQQKRDNLERLPILPLAQAVWLPVPHVIFAGDVTSPAVAMPFSRDAAIRSWFSEVDPRAGERRILQAWLNDGGISRWVVNRHLPADLPPLDNEPLLLDEGGLSEPDADASRRIAQWYREWRESSDYSAYTGMIDGALGARLMPAQLSPSALEDFGRCPLNFLLGRLLRIHSPAGEPLQELPQATGQWGHRALELMVVRQWPLSLPNMRQCVKDAMGEFPETAVVPTFFLRYQEDRLTAELYEALLRDGWSPGLSSEVEVELSWDWIWPMRGRVDRIDVLEGSVRLIDYKSGTLVNPAKPSPANLQMMLYHRAVSERYGQAVTAEMYGISQKSLFQHRALLVEDAAAQWEVVEAIGRGMQERMAGGQFFPVPDPRLNPCRTCPFQFVCPHAVVEYAAVKNAQHSEYTALWKPAEELQDDA